MGCKVSKPQYKEQFSYELLDQFDYHCSIRALALNQAKNLLVLGSDSEIHIFHIQKGFMKQLKIIKQSQTQTLNFFFQNGTFISGSADSLIIWSTNIISNIKFTFKMKDRTQGVCCVALHSEFEETIISGYYDGSIKIFGCSTQWFCKQIINEHTEAVNSLAINQNGNKFISCSNDNTLLIIKVSIQQKWCLKQRIQLLQYGFRLSFITNESFSFQPNSYLNGRYLYIFQLNSSTQLFEKVLEIPVLGRNQYCSQGFPSTYIQSKNLLHVKHGYYINIFRITPSKKLMKQYVLEQSIEFGTRYVFGTQSNDGELLITWDAESNQIQIRKLIFKR
ncbi:unnamed protein product [Paramecium sonneborni]|uniref:Uncharacterized protein n=1 Tax=Paramecium sonneborni TaxID=65129 RepID=A0A8S1LIT1_9CILI|nr:unnamed protein product [Paramecium sonneborni]